MTWTVGVHASAQQTGAIGSVSTPARDTSGAALLIVVVGSNGVGTPYTLSDNGTGGGNTFGTPDIVKAGGSAVLELYFIKAPKTNAAYVLTINSAGFASASIAFATFVGGSTTGGIDKSSTGGAGTSSFQAGAGFTPTNDNALVVAAASGQTNVTGLTIDAPFTPVLEQQTFASSDWPVALAYAIQTSKAAANPTWSGGGTGSGTNPALLASFDDAAGATGEPTLYYAQQQRV